MEKWPLKRTVCVCVVSYFDDACRMSGREATLLLMLPWLISDHSSLAQAGLL